MESDSERKKCAVVLCNEDKKNPITFEWKSEDELPIVGWYACLGVGYMDAIVTHSRLDTRVKRCTLMNVIVPKLEYEGELWKGARSSY